MATYDVKQIALPGGDIANLKDGNAIHKSDTSGFVKNDGSIDQNTYQIAQEGKGLSTNDFTNEDKALIGQALGNNTVLTTDKTPFLTRQTLNPTGFSGYMREKLVGASYAWNQLCANGNFATTGSGWTTTGGSLSISNNVGTFTSGAGSNNALRNVLTDYYIAGHKYLISFKYKSNVAFVFQPPANPNVVHCDITSNWTTVILIVTNLTYTATLNTAYWYNYDSLTAGAWVLQVMEYQAIDLTLAFGSTIADYLYGLSNNGGITKLRDMGFPIDKYTPYGYGLYSVKTSGKLIRGFNLVDKVNNACTLYASLTYTGETGVLTSGGNIRSFWCKIIPNTTYYIKKTNGTRFHMFATKVQPAVGVDTILLYNGGATSGEVYTTLAVGDYNYLVVYCDNASATINDVVVNINTPTGNPKNGDYVPSQVVTYPLGNDELRGKFDLVDGEIVASGDVKESNGEITRNYAAVNLGSLTWYYDTQYGTIPTFYAPLAGMKMDTEVLCAKYEWVKLNDFANNSKDKTIATGWYLLNNSINIHDTAYTDATAFKTAMNGVFLIYELATPTTEQSTPFADPMSLVGATTEEYIDTRDIPCPVGAERQYMGQSEDVVEIPSSPLSDGKRKLIAETSGGKTQYYWEGEGIAPVRKDSINIKDYTTENNAFTCPSDGYIFVRLPSGSGHVLMRLMDSLGNMVGTYIDAADAEEEKAYSVFVKRGIKTYAYCYVGETLAYTYWFYGIS